MWRTLALAGLLVATPALAKKPKKAKKQREQAPVEAIAPQETVALPCGYEAGAVHRYRIEKRSDQRLPGQDPRVQGNRSTVELTIVSHEGSRTLLDVRYADHEMLAPPDDPAAEALLERIAEVSERVPVRVEVDHAGSTQRVVDSSALVAAYAELAADVKALVRERQPEASDAVLAHVDAALANQQLAERGIVEDLQPLFGFTCGEVPVGEIAFQTALPNPLGSAPLPAVGTVSGTIADETVTFAVHERLDPVRVMDHLGPILEQLGVELPEGTDADEVLEMGTDLEVVVDRATGWPTRWSSARTGTVMGGGRTDTVVVTRVE